MNSLACTLDRKGFKTALGHASRVTERRNTIPILSYVRLGIGGDCVRLGATDLDLYLTGELPAATEGEGALILQLESLKAAVAKFAGDAIRIEALHDGKASVSCTSSGARMILPTMKADDWPMIKRGDMLAEFWAPAAAFAGAVATVLPFASSEETRYYLMGALIHAACVNPGPRTEEHEALTVERAELRDALQSALDEAGPAEGREAEAEAKLGLIRERVEASIAELDARIDVLETERTKPDSIRFVTTDGHRMARVTLPVPEPSQWRVGNVGTLPDVILPKKACKVLGAIVGKKPDTCDMRVAINGAKVELQFGRYTLLAKAIDGTFPDYTRVIPTQNEITLTVPADEFAVAVESTAAIANEKTRGLALSISETEGVILCCTSPENGTAANIFEGATVSEGAELSIGFNAAYLTDMLKAFGGNVTFHLADAAAPTLLTSDSRPEFIAVLMPMRVGAVVTTRADVEALSLSPFGKLQRQGPAIVKALADASAAGVGSHVFKATADTYLKPAIAFLVEHGSSRYVARQRVKAELAFAAGDHAAGDRALTLIDAYERQPSGSFGALSFREASDPGPQDPAALDPAQTEAEAAPVAADDDVNADPFDGFADASDFVDAPETVEAEAPVSTRPEGETGIWIEPTPVVKALTVTDQAVYVALADWTDDSVSSLTRYHADGYVMCGNGAPRTILRANLKRLVPPRNRGDRPMPAAKVAEAPVAPESDVAGRLAALERIVAGLAPGSAENARIAELEAELAERIADNASLRAQLESARAFGEAVTAQRDTLYRRRGCARRMVKHALKLRTDRTELRAQLARTEACLDDARGSASALAFRCDALERLHVASGPLDTAAAERNGKPAIILPVSRTSARAQ